MKVKEALEKIVYKATIQTYQQNQTCPSICLQEGYSHDLKSSIFADLEVEHISYDHYRGRVAITVTEEDCIGLLKTKSIDEINRYMVYYKGYRNMEIYRNKENDRTEAKEALTREMFILTVHNYGQLNYKK